MFPTIIYNIYKKTIQKLNALENTFAVLVAAAMVFLPLAEVIARKAFHYSFSGAADYLQHGALWIAFVGASLAARENKHLRLSTGTDLVKGTAEKIISVFHTSISVSVIAAFVIAGVILVLIEREGGSMITRHLPRWIAQIPMPLFMMVVGIRFIRLAKGGGWSKVLILVFVGMILSMGYIPEDNRAGLFAPGLILLILSVVLGAPLFVLLGGSALFLFFLDAVPLAAVPAEAYRIVSSPTLPTIPLFTLAGYVLAEGGASKRLVRLFRAIFGWMPGGIGIATIVVCAFFTTFTGASGVTILALGGILFPIFLKEKYPEKFSLGLITASGSVGILFPPALPIILYGVIAAIPIDKLFIAGIFPGTLIILFMALYCIYVFRTEKVAPIAFSFQESLSAVRLAKWDILMPMIIIFGIFGGFTTLVEAAALAAFYAIILECFIHKELSVFRDLPKTIIDCAKLVGGVMIVLGLAFGFTSFLIDAEIPSKIFEWVKMNIQSKLLFLIALNLFLIVVGCIMDIFSAIIVVVPIIIPIALAYEIHPIHLGIIFLVNLELGYLTPPVGLNLFLSAYRFNRSLTSIYGTVLPFLVLGALVVILVTYIPWISLAFIR